jgi:hypothetical protein
MRVTGGRRAKRMREKATGRGKRAKRERRGQRQKGWGNTEWEEATGRGRG